MGRSKVDEQTKAALEKTGAKIREARLAAGLSQAQLAEVIAMDRENFAKLERGTVNLTMDTLVRIARGLGLEVEVNFVPQAEPPPHAEG